MTVECDSYRFSDLVNPYTGKKIVVSMTVTDGTRPLFFSPETYSTSDRFPTAAKALEAWSRVDGVYGLRRPDDLRCAYTGEPLVIKQDLCGFYLDGGFDPHVPRPDSEFIAGASSRGGTGDVVPGGGRVELVERTEMSGPLTEDDPRTDEALHAAEDVVRRFKDDTGMVNERTVVSMSRRKTGRTR